jgi:transcriptional regulator with XRE-family HTH domain|uniref:Helix-turn-helix domain protein n=1 Tax=Caudovirales sp. ctlwr10 TaxID=2825771 RepID=A0A8S5Q691_9CAUD|nr:MAG TPA: helix-turn-helix domain protein [Caudovirales sp. ctlwr10]
MTTAERIKQRRKDLGLRAEDVAERIGVSRSTMFRYENGEIEKLPINHLVPIAKALHTSVDYLMGWTEDEKEPIPMDEDRLDQEFVRLFEQLGNDQKDLIVRAMKGILSEK